MVEKHILADILTNLRKIQLKTKLFYGKVNMKIKLIKSVEHWRQNGAVMDVIDEVNSEYEYGEFDEIIEEFQSSVAAKIEELGHEVDWRHTQSVGVGSILQNFNAKTYEVFSSVFHFINKC